MYILSFQEGNTSLSFACENGDLPMVEYLIRKGLSMKTPNKVKMYNPAVHVNALTIQAFFFTYTCTCSWNFEHSEDLLATAFC